jgi:hypothetical protein
MLKFVIGSFINRLFCQGIILVFYNIRIRDGMVIFNYDLVNG